MPALEILLEKTKKKEQFLHIHMQLSILLRVVSSDHPVDIERLEGSLNELYLYIVKEFPWARVSESLHALLGHGAEFVRRNGNIGLSTLSEQGSESTLYSLDPQISFCYELQ